MAVTLFWAFLFLFLSSWLIYPIILLVLRVFGGNGSCRWEDPGEWPPVSVLVAARNEEAVIGNRIRNLLEQDYRGDLQVLVGSDSSDDGTDRVAESFSGRGVVLYRSERRMGKPLMLQELLKLASGSILVFTDADTVFATSTVTELVRPYSDPSVGCVDGCRRNSLRQDTCESVYWRYEKKIKEICSSMGAVLGATGAVFSLRRDLFQPLSPGRADDFELAVMARLQGFRCVFNPEAVAMEPSPDDSRQYGRMVRIVSWMLVSCLLLMGRAVRERKPLLFLQLLLHKLLRWFSGLFLLAATAAAGFLTGSPFYAAVFILLCIFHLTAAAGALLRDRMPSKALFPYYFWLMNGAAADGILRTVFGKPVETWESRKGGNH